MAIYDRPACFLVSWRLCTANFAERAEPLAAMLSKQAVHKTHNFLQAVEAVREFKP
jgi:hypothetical protein